MGKLLLECRMKMPLKLLILADSRSPHIIKWVNGLLEKNIIILLVSLSGSKFDGYSKSKNLTIKSFEFNNNIFTREDGSLSKISYLKVLGKINKIIKEFCPDILHAHYASSYGLLGALTGFHPLVISVWGADVYNFPKKNYINKLVLKYNFQKADRILSTSKIMASEIEKYTSKKIIVTPFGIDLNRFKPKNVDRPFDKDSIVIGTIKSLEKKYGINILIDAYYLFKRKHPTLKTNLLIVGGGTEKEFLTNRVKELNISEETMLTGFVKYDEIEIYHNMIDLFVSVSIEDSESFGVAIIEASACQKAVVVSNVGGLPEVVENNETGLIVKKQNIQETADAIEKLVLNKNFREKLGINGRKKVELEYNLSNNINLMNNVYNLLLKNY